MTEGHTTRKARWEQGFGSKQGRLHKIFKDGCEIGPKTGQKTTKMRPNAAWDAHVRQSRDLHINRAQNGIEIRCAQLMHGKMSRTCEDTWVNASPSETSDFHVI